MGFDGFGFGVSVWVVRLSGLGVRTSNVGHLQEKAEHRGRGRELMAPRTDHTTRIPSGVASPVTKNHAAKGSVFSNLRNLGNF